MSKYSCYNIIKSLAKAQSKAQGIKHSLALDIIAKESGFANFHELSKVAENDHMDSRLVKVALGNETISEAVYTNKVWVSIAEELENQLSDAIASTNACGFDIDELTVNDSEYDDTIGSLRLEVSISYAGEQDPDRAYSASVFYLEANITLLIRDNEWMLAEDGLEITEGESDQDRDWEAQMYEM